MVYDCARRNGHEILVLVDEDGQHDAGDIPKLTEFVLRRETDVVIGMRWWTTNGIPSYRWADRRVLNDATAATFGVFMNSWCGFRAFSEKASGALDLSSMGFRAESEVLVRIRESGLRIDDVPVTSRYGSEGCTLNRAEQAAAWGTPSSRSWQRRTGCSS
jgi:hypothetical protein